MPLPTTPLQGPLEKNGVRKIPLAPFYPPFLARGRPATSVTSTRRVPRSGPRREDYSTDRNRWQSRKSTCGLSLLWLDPPTTPPTRLLLGGVPHYHYPQPPLLGSSDKTGHGADWPFLGRLLGREPGLARNFFYECSTSVGAAP